MLEAFREKLPQKVLVMMAKLEKRQKQTTK
jgi:hypothetical protein